MERQNQRVMTGEELGMLELELAQLALSLARHMQRFHKSGCLSTSCENIITLLG